MNLARTLLVSILVGGLALLAGGCEKEEGVVAYVAPKEPARPVRAAGAQTGTPTQGSGPQWTLPAGWKPIAASGMRYAAFQISDGEPPVTLTVIPLPPSSVAANVNRWEGELGLPASKEEDVDKLVQHIDANGLHIDAVDLTGPEAAGKPRQRTLAAMVEHGGKTWFFKATGPAEKLAGQKENFDAFLRSIKFGAPASATVEAQKSPQQPSQQPQAAAQGAKTSGLTAWTKPEGWKQDETSRAMRELTFVAGSEGATAEVIVSRMGTNFGGLLPNINRWRQQVGLGPVANEKDQPVTMLRLGDGPAAQFDMTGTVKAMRQIVVMTPRNDGVWFFKLLGPSETVEKEKGAFDAFVKSVKFAAAPLQQQ